MGIQETVVDVKRQMQFGEYSNVRIGNKSSKQQQRFWCFPQYFLVWLERSTSTSADYF